MIALTRLDGSDIGINHQQIERIDAVGNTVITMSNGNQYIVAEGFDEIVEAIVDFEATVLRTAERAPVVRARVRARRPTHLRPAGDPTVTDDTE